jgi:hypothetical protein
MDNALLQAIISGLFVSIPTIISTVATINRNNALQDERLKTLSDNVAKLTDKVEQHNQFGVEIPQLQLRVKHLEEEVAELKR